jgi:hypothetical protein
MKALRHAYIRFIEFFHDPLARVEFDPVDDHPIIIRSYW